MEDAVTVLSSSIPDNSISVMLIYFPDPWHKRRHHKRRLIQETFLSLLDKKLIKQGEIHIATDCVKYATHIEKCFDDSGAISKNQKQCLLL